MWTVHAILLTFESLHIPSINNFVYYFYLQNVKTDYNWKITHKNIVCTQNLKNTKLEYKIKDVTLYNI